MKYTVPYTSHLLCTAYNPNKITDKLEGYTHEQTDRQTDRHKVRN